MYFHAATQHVELNTREIKIGKPNAVKFQQQFYHNFRPNS